MSYSRAKAKPPKVVIVASAACHPASDASSFAMLASAPHSWPASNKAAALFEAQRPCGADANIGKLLAADVAFKAADMCLQTFGGFGYAREYGIERKWRECRLYQTAPISTNMVLAFIAQQVLGLPRSY